MAATYNLLIEGAAIEDKLALPYVTIPLANPDNETDVDRIWVKKVPKEYSSALDDIIAGWDLYNEDGTVATDVPDTGDTINLCYRVNAMRLREISQVTPTYSKSCLISA